MVITLCLVKGEMGSRREVMQPPTILARTSQIAGAISGRTQQFPLHKSGQQERRNGFKEV